MSLIAAIKGRNVIRMAGLYLPGDWPRSYCANALTKSNR